MDVKFFDEKIKQFVKELEIPAAAKVFRILELLERFGQHLGMPYSKHVDRGLFELRVRGTREVRLFYTFHKGAAVVLHGFIKQSQKIPRHEIKLARQKLSTLD